MYRYCDRNVGETLVYVSKSEVGVIKLKLTKLNQGANVFSTTTYIVAAHHDTKSN